MLLILALFGSPWMFQATSGDRRETERRPQHLELSCPKWKALPPYLRALIVPPPNCISDDLEPFTDE
jgi:hypothetical protein